jgi:hypothetical protein
MVKSQPGQIVCETLSQKYLTHTHTHTQKKWLVEWLKYEALSSNSSTTKKERVRIQESNMEAFVPVKQPGLEPI